MAWVSMTTGRQHHKEMAEFPPPTHIWLWSLSPSISAFLDPGNPAGAQPRPKRTAVWVFSVHTPGYTQSSLSSAQTQPSEGGRDRRKQHTPGTRAKQSRRDRAWGGGGPRGLHVTPGFPDMYLANQGDGESSEVEMVNRARLGETY